MPLRHAVPLLGIYLFMVALLVPLRGWALATTWAWFVAPALHLAPLTWQQAWGVAIVAQLAVVRHASLKERADDEAFPVGQRAIHALGPLVFYPSFVGFVWLARWVIS